MECRVSLDSLYVVVKPCVEVQEVMLHFWGAVEDVSRDTGEVKGSLGDQLAASREGVAVEDWLVRRGGVKGYKFSAWRGDARIFFTDNGDQGLWVQLGPKFILAHVAELPAAVERLLVSAGLPAGWLLGDKRLRTVVNRVDLCVDCLGLSMSAWRCQEWAEGWVGYAELVEFFVRNRVLETVNVGTRGGTLYLRVYDKVKQATKEGDIAYWRQAWGGYGGQVARVEWEVRPEGDGFADLVDFAGWQYSRLMQLAVYLLFWGHLGVPEADSNPSRWAHHPIWAEVEAGVVAWAQGAPALARARTETLEISPEFIDYLGDALVSGMAKCSAVGDLSTGELLAFLASKGWSMDKIQARAKEKYRKVSKLRSQKGEAV